MADNQTLLAHLALKLGSHPENIAVEALGYILSESESARRALEGALRTGGVDVGTISNVQTQASGEDGATPDLVCSDGDGRERVLIEAKFWAGLTDNQPVAYLKRLPTDKPSALVFVAPAARFETLWTELRRRAADAHMELGGEIDKPSLRSATAGGKRRLMLTSWATLLDDMASQASIAGDSRVATDIRQLLGLTQRMDEDAFLPIRSEELGPEFPRRILGLSRVIEDVTERGRNGGWVDTSGLSTSARSTGWGRYIRLGRGDRAGVLFGYSFTFWAKHQDTPLRLSFQEWDGTMTLREVRRRLEPLWLEDPPGIIEADGQLRIPIRLPVGVEETAVVDSVARQLKRVARMIDPKGFDQSEGQP